MPSHFLRVGLVQAPPEFDMESNRLRGEAFCAQAKSFGADLVVFPEMWSIGYAGFDPHQPGARDAWEALAVDPHWSWVSHFQDLARMLDLAIGITYLEKTYRRPRNSLSLFDRHGELVLHYSKIHTCEFDWECGLDPGDGFYVSALDTPAGPVQVGAMICFDREFPESARILMLNGAEIVLVPNACEMEQNRMAQLRTRAMENMMAVALANYTDPDNGGHSVAFDGTAFDREGRSRDMTVVEAGDVEGIYLATFDLDRLRDYRSREVWANAYRRPRLYGPLLSTEVHPPFIRPDATR